MRVLVVGLRDRCIPGAGVLRVKLDVARWLSKHHESGRAWSYRSAPPVVQPALRVGDAHVAHKRGNPGDRMDRCPQDAARIWNLVKRYALHVGRAIRTVFRSVDVVSGKLQVE